MITRRIAASVLAVLLCSPLTAFAGDVEVPDALVDWVPWVLHGHEDLACPKVADVRLCAWPGRLDLELGDRGGTFVLQVRADRELDLPLPGDATRWPRNVKIDGSEALMARGGATPTVHLSAGTHTVSGGFQWSRLPESLAVPPQVALLDLTVSGEAVAFPRRQEDGTLWLQGGRVDTAKEDKLAIEVHRRVDDGVPVVITTRLRLRVSGKSREDDLGVPLPAGTEPISLNSTLPARLDGQGHLRVQLRPGDQTITIRARSTGAVTSLSAPAADDRWPDEEVWVFSSSPAVRAVRVEGAPGVDPQRTSLDEDWRGLPAWRVERGGALQFVELRRGESEPPPDSVSVSRELWLSDGGKSFVVRDDLSGVLHEGGRLELQTPGALGHVEIGGSGQVIGALEGADNGVEVRDGGLNLRAELSYPAAAGIPAVGWNRDATSLFAQVNLPPGWSLLATTGVDNASGTWIDSWSLLDLFFLLLIALITWKTMDIRWAVLALVVLGLAWHEPICPQGWWIMLLALHALIGALRRGWPATSLQVLRWGLVVGLALHVLVFSWDQLTTGAFPQLEHYGSGPYTSGWENTGTKGGDLGWGGPGMGGMAAPQAEYDEYYEEAPMERGAAVVDSLSNSSDEWGGEGRIQQRAAPKTKRSSQVDPQAVVQTGSGMPRWKWNTYTLSWNGPVAQGHNVRLFLLPPWADLLLSILRVLGLVALALRFCDPRRNPKPKDGAPDSTAPPPAAAAAVALLAIAFVPGTALAQGAPDASLLSDLEARLAADPDCGDSCLEVPKVTVSAGTDGLDITMEVHAQATAVVRLPGPDTSWLPTRVTVDGRPVLALRRMPDGFVALRVGPGIHDVVAEGPARDEVALSFPMVPRVLAFSVDGWAVDGYRQDAPPPQSVRLSRSRPLQTEDGADEESAEMPPWLELRREMDVGIPWLVHNELRRLGPAGSLVHARVPLLAGEAVTSAGIPIEDDVAVVTLEGGETSRTWDSTLAEVDRLVLSAPVDRPWTERWELDCSPIWNCSAEGLAPVQHMAGSQWRPAWLPWPGEEVVLTFARPTPAQGATSTVDEASLELRPGRRVLESTLTFTLRSSQGGEQNVTIPADGQVISFMIDGVVLPLQQEGGKLTFSAEPGQHSVVVQWRQDQKPGAVLKAPAVSLSSGGANVLTSMEVPDNKWLVWAGGPRWGAVVTLWQYVLVLILAAWLLGRYARTDLKTHDWFILGLGMTQVPLVAPVIVVAWLILIGLRGERENDPWWAHDAAQFVLAGLTLLAFGMMYWAVYEGLLFQPDMQVDGAGSYGSHLQWYQDRTTGGLARPWVLWLPLWVWRVLMLVWALWLAFKTFRWVTWAWKQVSVGGLWKAPPPSDKTAATAEAQAQWKPEAGA